MYPYTLTPMNKGIEAGFLRVQQGINIDNLNKLIYSFRVTYV